MLHGKEYMPIYVMAKVHAVRPSSIHRDSRPIVSRRDWDGRSHTKT